MLPTDGDRTTFRDKKHEWATTWLNTIRDTDGDKKGDYAAFSQFIGGVYMYVCMWKIQLYIFLLLPT